MQEKTVKFVEMKDGDKEDYLLLKELEKPYLKMTPNRIIEELKSCLLYTSPSPRD